MDKRRKGGREPAGDKTLKGSPSARWGKGTCSFAKTTAKTFIGLVDTGIHAKDGVDTEDTAKIDRRERGLCSEEFPEMLPAEHIFGFLVEDDLADLHHVGSLGHQKSLFDILFHQEHS